MTAAFTQFKIYNVYKTDQVVGSVDVYMGKESEVDVIAEKDISVGLARIGRSALRSELHIKTAIAPVSKGDVVGDIIVFEGEKELKRIKALAANDVAEKSIFGKASSSLLN